MQTTLGVRGIGTITVASWRGASSSSSSAVAAVSVSVSAGYAGFGRGAGGKRVGSSSSSSSSTASPAPVASPFSSSVSGWSRRRSSRYDASLAGTMGTMGSTTTTTVIRTITSTTSATTTVEPPPPNLQVAIVGAGPSGFYVAKYLRSSIDKMMMISKSSSSPSHDDDSDPPPALQPLPHPMCTIDLLERLPTPFGLVRSGVAPDHPEVKNVEHDFEALMEEEQSSSSIQKNDASSSSTTKTSVDISYMGNVNAGVDVTLEELLGLYDAVVLSYGCSSDRKLGIDGEDGLNGIFSAREFVAWYNGHPDFVHLGPKVEEALSAGEGKGGRANVVVVGQGNVALDCARILAKAGGGGHRGGDDDVDDDATATTGGLRDTDVARHALEVLEDGGGGGFEVEGGGSTTSNAETKMKSRVGRIVVVGRRGHVQGAFTIKELRELTKLRGEGYDADFIVRGDELDMGLTEASERELKSPGGRPKIRIDKLLRDAANKARPDGSASTREVELRFLMSPKAFLPSDVDPSRVGSVLCERTRLAGDVGRQVAEGTGRTEEIPADMVLVSIGYRGVPLPGSAGEACFDGRRGIVANEHGKVRIVAGNDDTGEAAGETEAALPEHGLYVAGWLKRGPTGIIGTNIADARDTVSTILSDFRNRLIGRRRDCKLDGGIYTTDGDSTSLSNQLSHKLGRKGLVELLKARGVQVVSWEDYRRIDEAEKDEGRRRPLAPREKIVDVDEMLQVAQGGTKGDRSR